MPFLVVDCILQFVPRNIASCGWILSKVTIHQLPCTNATSNFSISGIIEPSQNIVTTFGRLEQLLRIVGD